MIPAKLKTVSMNNT